MNIDAITINNNPIGVGSTAMRYRPVLGAQSASTVFCRDILSLGNTAPQYQTYSVTAIQQSNKYWEYYPFGSVARICMSQLFLVFLGDDSLIPDGSGVQRRELYEEEWEFLQAFHERILKNMHSNESAQEATERAEGDNEVADDEIIDTIIAKYTNEPIGHELFWDMMQELSDTGLFTKQELSILRGAGRMGIRVEEARLHLEFIDFVHKNGDKNLSVPDLYELFMEELEKRDKEITSQRIANEADDNEPVGDSTRYMLVL